MKKILITLASISLLAAPILATPVAAAAQSHRGGGGYHGGGGFHGGVGAFHGGGRYHGGGYRGGYRGGGYYGGGYYRHRGNDGWGYVGAGILGLAVGSALSSSYNYPTYYETYPAYGAPVYRERVYSYSDGYAYGGPPQACGAWSWDSYQGRYFWIPC